ncbi:MAG: DUF2141 domain-containing protein [Salibacteraceae bacterium]|nr:DUF2141 domain-containing protein [Salibacteraceae bacterium]|tara:strand:- start:8132 stop:8539 length:408 start_codon:yes stop_codon:yes gene_type:complete
MQSIRTCIFLLFLLVGQTAKSQDVIDVTLKFDHLESNNGYVMLLIQDEGEKDVAKVVLPILNKIAEKTIKMAAGNYGFSAYHDVNANEKLDLNLFGAPTEAYGFSNNARSTFSKPSFSETLVDVSKNRIIKFKLE